jgi:hypothetical protein
LDEKHEGLLKEIKKANRAHAHRLAQQPPVAFRPLQIEELAEVLPQLKWMMQKVREVELFAGKSHSALFKLSFDDGSSQIVQSFPPLGTARRLSLT